MSTHSLVEMPALSKHGDLVVHEDHLELFEYDVGMFDGVLRSAIPVTGAAFAIVDLGVDGKMVCAVRTKDHTTDPYLFASQDEEKADSLAKVLESGRVYGFGRYGGHVVLQNHTAPVIGRGMQVQSATTFHGLVGSAQMEINRGTPAPTSDRPHVGHPGVGFWLHAIFTSDRSYDYWAIAEEYGHVIKPGLQAADWEPEEQDGKYISALRWTTEGTLEVVDLQPALGAKKGGLAMLRGRNHESYRLWHESASEVVDEYLSTFRRYGWRVTGRWWLDNYIKDGTHTHDSFPDVAAHYDITRQHYHQETLAVPGNGVITVPHHNAVIHFDVEDVAGYDNQYVVARWSGRATSIVRQPTSDRGASQHSALGELAVDGMEPPGPPNTTKHGDGTVLYFGTRFPVRWSVDVSSNGSVRRYVQFHANRVPGATPGPLLDGVSLVPVIGSLGPVEEALVLEDVEADAFLVASGLGATDRDLGVRLETPKPRPVDEFYNPLLGGEPAEGTGYQDVVVLYIRARVVKKFYRFDDRALEFVGAGGGLSKPPPQRILQSYQDLGKELAGQPFAIAIRNQPYRVPMNVVERTELFRAHKKAREKACKKNNFMSLPYAKGLTWGQANTACNRMLALSTVYSVQWSVPVPKQDAEAGLPSRIVFRKNLSSYYATVTVDRKDVEMTSKDSAQIAFWISRGVTTSGPIGEAMAAWGYDDVSVDGLKAEKTVIEYENARMGGNHEASVLGYNPMSFHHMAYASAGYPDLDYMDAQDAYKAIIASVNIYGPTGGQLMKLVGTYRNNIPAAIYLRGKKLLARTLEPVIMEVE